jgi:hypothetical protein
MGEVPAKGDGEEQPFGEEQIDRAANFIEEMSGLVGPGPFQAAFASLCEEMSIHGALPQSELLAAARRKIREVKALDRALESGMPESPLAHEAQEFADRYTFTDQQINKTEEFIRSINRRRSEAEAHGEEYSYLADFAENCKELGVTEPQAQNALWVQALRRIMDEELKKGE